MVAFISNWVYYMSMSTYERPTGTIIRTKVVLVCNADASGPSCHKDVINSIQEWLRAMCYYLLKFQRKPLRLERNKINQKDLLAQRTHRPNHDGSFTIFDRLLQEEHY